MTKNSAPALTLDLVGHRGNIIDTAVSFCRKHAPKGIAVAAVGAAGYVQSACAQIADTAADGIVTHASSTLVTVGSVVAASVGFFIIVAVVKWVRTR